LWGQHEDVTLFTQNTLSFILPEVTFIYRPPSPATPTRESRAHLEQGLRVPPHRGLPEWPPAEGRQGCHYGHHRGRQARPQGIN
jgi:hypothetical protein